MQNIKQFLNENQDPKAVEKILSKVTELLTKGEEVEYIAVQKKPAVNFSPDCIALTNKRVLFCHPKTFGLTMDFKDFLWKDVIDCHMKEGILGASFSVKSSRGFHRLDYLPKAQARKLYRYGQEREEEMQEYRRERDLESARASAGGGIYVNPPQQQSEERTMKNGEDPMASLQKLKELHVNDLITNEEYENKKAEILTKL